MGPIIILDKSALQSLSFDEIITLHKYYFLNIAPVLTIEILGDLKKPSKNTLSEEKVTELANKLLPLDSAINVYYMKPLIGSLLGYDIKMDGRPHITAGNPVQTSDGKRGIIIEETPEEKALFRWKNGEFTEAERILAERWRESTRGIDLERLKNLLKDAYSTKLRFKNLQELKRYLDELLMNSAFQVTLLKLLIFEFNLSNDIAQKIFFKWETEGYKLIKEFAPYAFYCISVNLFFQLGLMNNLIGTRSTNSVDLEYLYYFPFCRVFGSNDKFHKLVSPFFLKPNQSFISGQELKLDLNAISDKWKELDEKGRLKWKSEYGSSPPDNSDSLSSRLWYKHMGAKRYYGDINLSKEGSKKLAESIRKTIDSEINSPISKEDFDSDKADFVIRKRKISASDICPCGSGEQFKDCHGKELV